MKSKFELIILDDEFQKSEIYKDIGDYKNMTLLALSKKLPFWIKKYNEIYDGDRLKKIHLKNYCRDCSYDAMFRCGKILLPNIWGRYPTKETAKIEFWENYREQFAALYSEAKRHFDSTKTANEEVQCSCGGHYQSAHKAKHFKTKNHLLNYNAALAAAL
jgi:hypothetical protein